MDDRRVEFAEAILGRPLKDVEKHVYLQWFDRLEKEPKLHIVMERHNGYNPFWAQLAMYQRMYDTSNKEMNYHETSK